MILVIRKAKKKMLKVEHLNPNFQRANKILVLLLNKKKQNSNLKRDQTHQMLTKNNNNKKIKTYLFTNQLNLIYPPIII